MTGNDFRARYVDQARLLSDLIADPGHPTYQRFKALIATGETDARAEEMLRESTCGLTVRGLWQLMAASVPWPHELQPPYRDSSVMGLLFALAAHCGAIRRHDEKPEQGDAIHLIGPEHVYTVLDIQDNPYGGWDVESLDGGQLSGPFQATRIRQRVLVPKTKLVVEDQEVDGPIRRVWNVYNVAAIAAVCGGMND